MYFVIATISGGGVGSNPPCNRTCCLICLNDGFTGLFGSIERNFALMSMPAPFGFGTPADATAGVGRTFTGRAGPGRETAAFPGRGPAAPTPVGPGLGALPAVFAITAALVGLGLGTPCCAAGD